MYQEKNILFNVPANELAKKAVFSGTMSKQDKKVGMIWRKRFFVLMYTSSEDTEEQGRYGFLFYFNSAEDRETKSKINLRKTVKEISTKKLTLRIELKEGRVYYFSCDKSDELEKWYNALMDASQGKLPENATDSNDYIHRSKKAHKIQHTHLSTRRPRTTLFNKPRPIISDTPPDRERSASRKGSVVINMQVFSSRNSVAAKEQLAPWKEWAIETMLMGSPILKFPYQGASSGRPKLRFMTVSPNNTHIIWGTSRDPKMLNRKIPVANIRQIIYGPYSLTMNKYSFNHVYAQTSAENKRVVPWRCISIVVVTNESTTRTVDLQFSSDHETLAWFVGLQSICPSSVPVNIQMSQFKWAKLKLMLLQKVFLEESSSGYSSISDIVSDQLSQIQM